MDPNICGNVNKVPRISVGEDSDIYRGDMADAKPIAAPETNLPIIRTYTLGDHDIIVDPKQ